MAALYNLIIFHNPPHQQVSDFETIRSMMKPQAPDIEVHVLTSNAPIPKSFWPRTAERPTVLFSPCPINVPREIRGARLISKPADKMTEATLLARAGFLVPETRLITPSLQLDDAVWGPFTVVKPNVGFLGRGVRLKRTRDVRWIDTSALPKDDPRYGTRLLAQRYIDTGPYARSYRVMTVLGRPVYSVVSMALEKQAQPAANDEIEVAANSVPRTMLMSDEPDVIALAKAIHAQAPRLPMMAIDIIREEKTGLLFVLEYNSAGYSWHLSSDYGRKQQQEFNLNYYDQFNALTTICKALIEVTRTWAA
jgi:hypothetical protein